MKCGVSVVQGLPLGRYHVGFRAQGFAEWSGMLEIRSEVPQTFGIALGVAPVNTQVQVSDSATLVDPSRAGVTYTVGKNAIEEQIPVQPGRTLTDLVNDQPEWIYEANGVLHPRGSEYDVQFVFDGLPLTRNRSRAFAPSLDPDDVESMRVLTASYPAEYGRKLGGVVEVTTNKNPPDGLHGELGVEGGSFATASARFAVTQDQRNTLRARIRMQTTKRTWIALGGEYGSGLPVELDPTTVDVPFLLTQYGPEIVGKVNFARGRVAPNFSLGAAAGREVYRKEQRSVGLQVQGENLTDRVNVLNFASLFSGTAVASPRSVSARLRLSF